MEQVAQEITREKVIYPLFLLGQVVATGGAMGIGDLSCPESRHGRLVGSHAGELSVACVEGESSIGRERSSITREGNAMRGLKKDQLVQKADEELSGLRWLLDNFKAAKPQEERES